MCQIKVKVDHDELPEFKSKRGNSTAGPKDNPFVITKTPIPGQHLEPGSMRVPGLG